MNKAFDVVALGEAMVEFNQTRPTEAQYLQGFGGDTSNAVIAAARAGARTAYLTRLGDDIFGHALLQLWRTEGVDTSGVDAAPDEPTGIYFVTHDGNGHAFTYRRAGSAASRMTPQWLEAGRANAILQQTSFLHVSGISMAISQSACASVLGAMRIARAAGAQVAFDSNLRLKLWPARAARAAMAQAVALSDIFLPSLEDMTALCGLDDPGQVLDWGHAHGARSIALKLGANGALVSDGSERRHLAGHAVARVDATGAGDCFCGNLLARMAAGDAIFEAARYANAASALAVQGYGAVAPLPRPQAVRAML